MAPKNVRSEVDVNLFFLKLLSFVAHLLGVFLGVYVFIVINVNLSMSDLVGVGLDDLPNMDPRIGFVFIPVLFVGFGVLGFMGLLMVYSFGWSLRWGFPWFLNGFVYSLPIVFLIVIRWVGFWPALVFSFFVFIYSLILLYKYFGNRVLDEQ